MAARVAAVVVFIDCCVRGAVGVSSKLVGPRIVGASNAGVHAITRRGEAILRWPRIRAIRGGNEGTVPSLGSEAW